jgi:hypothetical protein
MNQPLEDSINDMKDVQEKLENATKPDSQDTPDSKDDKGAANILFKQISETSIEILQTPEVEAMLDKISQNSGLNQNSMSALVSLIAICMTHSAHNAILFYDDLLKKELTKQMDNISHHMNLCKADIEGIKGAIQIHQKQIGIINNSLKIDDVIKNMNSK